MFSICVLTILQLVKCNGEGGFSFRVIKIKPIVKKAKLICEIVECQFRTYLIM
ncbi:hypothetical protein EDF67_10150 [Sphingobacterium sp. JUb78]|nr:hypothetical protein [Sphingobacterium kitahiroshimense]TCR13947.1 hypothetical protein EDF67_10150 [Sphingobacterium sp. JUb78]